MNREIKFRIWDNKLKEMNLFLKIENGEQLMHFACINADKNRFEIMQFTGLKDSDENEIWEGDIIKYVSNANLLGDIIYEHKIVEFRNGMFGLGSNCVFINGKPEISPLGYLLRDCYPFKTAIIGNIWENPELLEKKCTKS